MLAAENKDKDHGNWVSHPGWSALVACTLVCKAWYLRSWYHLHWQISLRKRDQVAILAKLFRAEPQLRRAVQRITIAGGLDKDQQRLPIPHLATFAATLVRMLPNVTELMVRHAEWRLADVRVQLVSHLDAFRSAESLKLVNVTFASAMLFGRLLAALPSLERLGCISVRCPQKEPGPLVLLPPVPRMSGKLGAVSLCEPVDPAIQALLVRCAEADGCKLQWLVLEVEVPSEGTLASMKGQQLLDSSVAHLVFFGLNLYTEDIAPEAQNKALEPYLNLSRAAKLRHLSIDTSCPNQPDFSWLATILATVESDGLQRVAISFGFHKKDDAVRRLEILFDRLEQNDDLTLMDDVLARKQFTNTKPGAFFMFLDVGSSSGALTASDGLGNRWHELVRRKMPQIAKHNMLGAFSTYP
ncbi:hypothetical protein EVJ58_g2072 [Rhodofomes roseus]|uniref:Uncharacterized protein n=1 Tax=Rhodofomes roseus TaxID=34475 RepID=A0A4Y9YSC2_9APHY|nr:hypothetical protein EVJ58_g2072 [Rhodofomes roseus]